MARQKVTILSHFLPGGTVGCFYSTKDQRCLGNPAEGDTNTHKRKPTHEGAGCYLCDAVLGQSATGCLRYVDNGGGCRLIGDRYGLRAGQENSTENNQKCKAISVLEHRNSSKRLAGLSC